MWRSTAPGLVPFVSSIGYGESDFAHGRELSLPSGMMNLYINLDRDEIRVYPVDGGPPEVPGDARLVCVSKDAGEELDGSAALDETIDLFSGQAMEDLARRAYREKLKKELEHRLDEAYDGEVIGVYFTDFVTQ